MPSDMRTCLWVGLGVSATVGLGGFLAYRAYNSFVRGGEIQVEPSMDGEEAEADTGFKEEAADAPVKLTPIEEEEEEEEEERRSRRKRRRRTRVGRMKRKQGN